MRTPLVVVAVAVLVASSTPLPIPAQAAVLCAKKSGGVVVREVCRKKETPLTELGVSVQGAQGAQGPAGPPGAAGAPGTSVFAEEIPSGTTVTGVWATLVEDTAGVSFPVPAPDAPQDSDVNFAPDASSATDDDDASCTGSFQSPTAPPGKVCLYVDVMGPGVGTLRGYGLGRRGFFVYSLPNSPSNTGARGSWAYTAP
jgi:hypothetical protein